MTSGVSGPSRLRCGLLRSVTTSLVLMTTLGVMTFLQGVAPESPLKSEIILQSYTVHSNIFYRYAITQVSSQVKNPTHQKQRVNFTIILPENAYITSFVMDVGGQLYKTTVTESTQPDVKLKEIEAVRARDSNVFRASICLPPGGTIARFHLSYEELLQRRLGVYQHVINLHPGQVAQEMRVEVVIHEGRNISALHVPRFWSGHEIEPNPQANSSHTELDTDNLIEVIRPSPTKAHIRLVPTPEQQENWRGQWKRTKNQRQKMAQRRGGHLMERGIEGQLVVLYDVARDLYNSKESGGEVVVQGGYFVHFFSPANLPLFNRHLVLVIDTSESMKGRKWRKLKVALKHILCELKSTEYFSIIKFNSKKSVWNPYPKERRKYEIGGGRVVPATNKYLELAKRHLKKLKPSNGTKTLRGLLKGLSVARESRKLKGNSTLFPMIILITDGENSMDSNDLVFDEMNHNAANSGNLYGHWEIPIFCMGYEPDSDIPFLRAISRRSAGGFAGRIYDASDSDLQINELHAKSAFPELGGVRFIYSNNVGDLEVDPETLTHTRFYTLMSGSELVVAGRLKGHFENSFETKKSDPNLDVEHIIDADRGPSLKGVVTATSAKGRAIFPISSTVADAPFPLDRLWAYLMISQLNSQEAAQKVWGSYWTEKNLNGVNTSSTKTDYFPQEIEVVYRPDLAANISYLLSSSKLMAMHHSFVCPGMTLKFEEMQDDSWDYNDQRLMDYDSMDSDTVRGRRKRHPRKSRPHKGGFGGGDAGHGFSRGRYDDYYDRGPGQCSSGVQGIYWSTLPLVPRPSSLCQIEVHNLTCPDALPKRHDSNEKYPLVKSLTDLAWLDDVKTAANMLSLKGYRGAETCFKLGFGQEDKEFDKCRTPAGIPGHCRHLIYCLLKDFAADYSHFLKFVCHIDGSPNYIGVCCPDYLYKSRSFQG